MFTNRGHNSNIDHKKIQKSSEMIVVLIHHQCWTVEVESYVMVENMK